MRFEHVFHKDALGRLLSTARSSDTRAISVKSTSMARTVRAAVEVCREVHREEGDSEMSIKDDLLVMQFFYSPPKNRELDKWKKYKCLGRYSRYLILLLRVIIVNL